MKTMIENDFVFRAGPKMAAVLGINEALVLGMVDYWINKNKENGINYKNDRYWTFNTLKKWRERYFYFWSERTVQRIFESLEDKGLLIVGNFNKVGFDRTKWYSIDYDRFDELVAEKSDLINKYEMKEVEEELEIDMTNCPDATCQVDEMQNDRLSSCNTTTCHNANRQIDYNNTNNNTTKTTFITQQPGQRVVAIETKGMLKEFLGYSYTDSYASRIINILMSKEKGCDYLREKIELAKNRNVDNKCAFLMAALQSDYKSVNGSTQRDNYGTRKNRNKFINFEQTVYKYSKEELDEMIRRKNRF